MHGLLVGAAPNPELAGLLARLAPRADLVVAVDGGGVACRAAGVTPQFVVGDLDSLDPGTVAEFRATGVEILSFPAEKDESDLDLALSAAARRGVTHVTVAGVVGARFDHTLASLCSLARRSELHPEIAEPDFSAWVMSAEHTFAIEMEGEGATISLTAVLETASVSISGVRWPLAKHELAPLSSLGLSNVITGERARVEVHSGSAVVSAPRVGSARVAKCVARHSR